MHKANRWPRVTESFPRVLARNVAIALAVGAVFSLRSGDAGLLLRVAALALWFSLGGHYVEIAFLNHVRPLLGSARWVHVTARLLAWFAGGVALSALMLASARFLFEHPPAGFAWWVGGVAFVVVELLVHAMLALHRAPNFYDGRG